MSKTPSVQPAAKETADAPAQAQAPAAPAAAPAAEPAVMQPPPAAGMINVPSHVTPAVASTIKQFLERVQCTGPEAYAWVAVNGVLDQVIAQGKAETA